MLVGIGIGVANYLSPNQTGNRGDVAGLSGDVAGLE